MGKSVILKSIKVIRLDFNRQSGAAVLRKSHYRRDPGSSLVRGIWFKISYARHIMQSTTSVAAVGLCLTGALLRSLIIVFIHQMIRLGTRKWILIYGVCNEL